MDRVGAGSSLEPENAGQSLASHSEVQLKLPWVLRRVGLRVLSQRSPNSSSTLYDHNPAVYRLTFVNPEEEPAQTVIRREPLHSTPAGSPPSSPRRPFSGVSPIPVLESEESFFDSSEGEREVSQPSEMAGAGADPEDAEMTDFH